MAITLVDVGSTANDGTGDPLRTAFQTVNTALTRLDNTVDVQTGYVLLKDDGGSAGVVVTTAGNVGIGTTNPSRVLTIRSSASNTNVFAVNNNDNSSEIFFVNENPTKDGRVFVRDGSNNSQVVLNSNGSSYFTGGGLGILTTNPTEALDVDSDAIRVRTSQTPASASATGDAGQICWDANYIYVCTATNTWKRAALATW